MTARSERRRRRTLVGALVGLSLVVAGGGLAVVGANAIANSTEGEAVAVDDRPVVSLPATDNAALAIVDAQGRLTSLIVVTVLPSGQGGTIVTVPVTADANVGLGERRESLAASLDPNDPASFFELVEGTLAITLQYGEIVGDDRLLELIEPSLPAEVVLPIDVVDSSLDGDGDGDGSNDSEPIVAAGESTLDGPSVAAVLSAIDVNASERQRHAIDVATWTALAAGAPGDGTSAPPVDEVGRPLSAASIDELFIRLWGGPVQVRDLTLDPIKSDGSQPVLDAQAVVLDRGDAILVFSQISPARVSTPNPGPVFRVEIPISDAQLEESQPESGFESRRAVGLNVIRQLVFLQSNVVSIDATQDPDGAPSVTRIEVAEPQFVESMQEQGPIVFGEVDVVLAERTIDGVDVVIRLGTDYLVAQALESEQVDSDGPSAAPDGPDAPTTDGAGTVDADG